MSIGKIPEETKAGLSVRDFLKVSGLSLAAAATGKYFSREGDKSGETSRSEWREMVGCDKNIYIPIYEHHEKPWRATEFEKLPDVDVAFYEVVRPAKDMLKGGADNLVGWADEEFTRDRWMEPDHLRYWSEKGSFIAFEGLDYNASTMALKYACGVLVEGFLGLRALAESFSDKASVPIKIGEKEVVAGEVKQNLLRFGGIWGSSAFLDIGVGFYMKFLLAEGSEGMKNMSLVVQRLAGATSQVHPEFDVIFLRNIIMARRLQAIGEYFPVKYRETDRIKGSPKTISFNVGAKHIGVEDWLALGPDAVKLALEMYPSSLWKELADLNGGTEAMATMPIIRPGSNFFDDKIINLKDEWLGRFLLRKVDRE